MMGIQNQQLKQKVDHLRIDPTERVWNRLEKRLDQDRDKIKISTLRKWMAFAASVLILVTILFLVNRSNHPDNNWVIVDLEQPPVASFAAYQYASEFNAIYDQMGWTAISEGSKRRLKSRLDRQSPAIDLDNDSLRGKRM
ncbi:MAG: hypothetical protein IPL46_12775 [Saprospiraceae bacterium]|nr:hypothetical protein [Saprospiraceae bacterium]